MSDEDAIFHRLHPSRALTVGTRVQLHGLTGRPELNGVCGEVIGAPHSKTSRIPIRLTNGESVLLKLQNLLGILAQRTFEALSVDAPDMLTRLEGKHEMFRSICFMLDAVSMYRLRCCSREMRELAPTDRDYVKFGGHAPRRLVELARRSLTDQPRLAMVQAVIEHLITAERRRPAQFYAEVVSAGGRELVRDYLLHRTVVNAHHAELLTRAALLALREMITRSPGYFKLCRKNSHAPDGSRWLLEVVEKAMGRHPEAHLVQCLAIDVIHALMQGDASCDARLKISVHEALDYDGMPILCKPQNKCIELLVKAMKTFSSDENVQSHATSALWCILRGPNAACVDSDDNLLTIENSGSSYLESPQFFAQIEGDDDTLNQDMLCERLKQTLLEVNALPPLMLALKNFPASCAEPASAILLLMVARPAMINEDPQLCYPSAARRQQMLAVRMTGDPEEDKTEAQVGEGSERIVGGLTPLGPPVHHAPPPASSRLVPALVDVLRLLSDPSNAATLAAASFDTPERWENSRFFALVDLCATFTTMTVAFSDDPLGNYRYSQVQMWRQIRDQAMRVRFDEMVEAGGLSAMVGVAHLAIKAAAALPAAESVTALTNELNQLESWESSSFLLLDMAVRFLHSFIFHTPPPLLADPASSPPQPWLTIFSAPAESVLTASWCSAAIVPVERALRHLLDATAYPVLAAVAAFDADAAKAECLGAACPLARKLLALCKAAPFKDGIGAQALLQARQGLP